MDDWEIELAVYTPRQAEKTTGIKMVRQRDLRRHGYLSRHDGVAAFTGVELGKMMVLSVMMERGIGPADAVKLADLCAIGIMQWALADPLAWEGMEKAEWTFPWEQTAKDKAKWLARVFSNRMARDHSTLWRANPGRFFIMFADGREFWTNSVDDEIAKMELTDPRLTGPLLVIDLRALAALLLSKTDLPLARIITPAD